MAAPCHSRLPPASQSSRKRRLLRQRLVRCHQRRNRWLNLRHLLLHHGNRPLQRRPYQRMRGNLKAFLLRLQRLYQLLPTRPQLLERRLYRRHFGRFWRGIATGNRYSCMANRARVLHLPGVSGLLPLQGFGLWFVWASGICSPRACCLRGTDAPTPVALGGVPRQALVLVSAFAVDFRHAQRFTQGGNHIGLPLQNGVSVGADLCVCPTCMLRSYCKGI